jgi:hypothetical protein
MPKPAIQVRSESGRWVIDRVGEAAPLTSSDDLEDAIRIARSFAHVEGTSLIVHYGAGECPVSDTRTARVAPPPRLRADPQRRIASSLAAGYGPAP